MREQHLVDLARRDLLAAAIDQLLDPPDQREVALGVEKALIAGPEPAVGKRRGVGFWVVFVPRDDVRPLDDDLAALPRLQKLPGGVHDADADVGAASDRPRLADAGWQRIRRHLVRRLGHAVRLEHRRAKRGLELVHDLRRQRRAARSNETEAFGPGRPSRREIRIGAGEQQLVQRRHCRVPRHAVIPGNPPERQRTELRRHDDGAAGRQRGERRRDKAMHVEQRHDAERDIVGAEPIAARDVARRDGQVRVGERHALGTSGTAARVQNERDVAHRGRRRRAVRAVGRRPGDLHRAARIHLDRQDGNAIAGRAPGLLRAGRRKEQHAGVGVLEVEPELVFLVTRIERRRGSGHRRREKRDDRRQAVGQRHADAIAPPDAGRRKRGRDCLDLRSQPAVAHTEVLLWKNDRGL